MQTLLYVPLLLTVFNVLPLRWYLHEITTSGGMYLLMHHLVMLVLFYWIRTPKSKMRRTCCFVALVLGVMFYGIRLLPFYISGPEAASPSEGTPITLYYSNLRTENTQHQKTRDLIEASNPDLVALLEADEKWLKALHLSKTYPFSMTEVTIDNFSVALFSKFPISERAKIEKSDGMAPVILAPVLIGGQEVLVVVLHTRPPIGKKNYHRSRVILRRIGTTLRHTNGNVIVAGDFNSSPFSRFYGGFRTGAKLKHVWWGRGLIRTWNARVPLFYFMIDHVFYKGALQVVDATRLEDSGSDHFPLEVKFRLHQ